MKIKKLTTNSKLKGQVLWFIGLYVAAVLAMSLFYELTQGLIFLLR